MRFAKLVPLLVFGALLCAPAGSATSLTPNATFYVPLPIPILLTSDWANTAAVAVSPDGNLVYVTDEKGSQVWELSSDGVLLSKWTSGALKRPTGVATDPLGNVYVANNGNGTVAKFTAGGKLVKRWSVPAAKSIAVGGGRVYVLTALFNAVGEYSYAGAKLTGFVASFPDQWWHSRRLRPAVDPDRQGDRHGQLGQPDRGRRVRSAAVEQRAGLPQRDRHPSRARPPSIFRPAAQRRGGALHAGRRAHGARIHEPLEQGLHQRLGQRRLHHSPGLRSIRTAATSSCRCTNEAEIDHLRPDLVDPDDSAGLPGSHALFSPCYICGKKIGDAPHHRRAARCTPSTAARTCTWPSRAASSSSTSTSSRPRARSATSSCRSRRSKARST